MRVPTIVDVQNAANRLEGEAYRTQLLKNDKLDYMTGAKVFLKPECLQRTGSFKFRGAYNAISQLSESERARGVIACSSGNHAQGVSKASGLFGVKSTIIMPSDAPEIKIRRTKENGAEVVLYERSTEDREAVVAKLQAQENQVLVHPFNDFNVIAGQGTVGLEIAEDVSADSEDLDRVLVCTGGGGLTAGVCIGIRAKFPNAKIHTVEPEGFDDYKRSVETGTIQSNTQLSGSICDAILSPSPGEIGFEVCRPILSDGLIISDEEAREAMRFAYNELKLVVEPGGAAALAALLKHGKKWQGETIAVVISGGNVDPVMFGEIISQ